MSTAVGAALVFAACTSTAATEPVQDPSDRSTDTVASVSTESLITPTSGASSAPSSSTSVAPPPPTTEVEVTTTPPPSGPSTTVTTTPTPDTTTTVPLDVVNPDCVVQAVANTSVEAVADAHGPIDPVAVWLENDQMDIVTIGDLIDICPNNSLNDVNGEPRPRLDETAIQAALAANVERQQVQLNGLFSGFGTGDLEVDGVSGPRTGQRLCAARLALGLDATIDDMAPGSMEQATLFAADSLPTPNSTAIESERWVLIDRTCQMMFIGSGADTTFVFPTSTGSEGFETRDQDRSEAFRFNPALDNGGWHDSSEFPVGVDNPLNGNLYKPLYFDLGQAIHGANNVPPTPESKGCARLRVEDQNTFVEWLGLDSATGETWRKAEMNVTVNVQGEFVPRS